MKKIYLLQEYDNTGRFGNRTFNYEHDKMVWRSMKAAQEFVSRLQGVDLATVKKNTKKQAENAWDIMAVDEIAREYHIIEAPINPVKVAIPGHYAPMEYRRIKSPDNQTN